MEVKEEAKPSQESREQANDKNVSESLPADQAKELKAKDEEAKVTTVEPALSSTQQTKPAEKGVTIAVGTPADPVEEGAKPATGHAIVDEERYNEYLFSTAGPRKQRIFGAVENEEDDDLAAFDADAGVTQQAVDGAYGMQHRGEKFALGGVAGAASSGKQGKEKTPEEIEAEEMAAALE